MSEPVAGPVTPYERTDHPPGNDAVTDPGPDELHRLHVLTPWLQSWRYLLGVVGVAVAVFRDNLTRLGDAWRFVQDQPLLLVLVLGVGAFVVVAGVSVGIAFLSWRMTGYAVTGSTLFLRRGVLMRQRRQVRLDRLQGVDVQQPLLGRLFGLAALKLELAAGKEATTTLSYLTLADARTLRDELMALSGRRTVVDPETGAVVPDQPERMLLAVPTERVLQARLLESSLGVIGLVVYVLAATVVVLVIADQGLAVLLAAMAPVGPWLLAIGGVLVTRFLQEANFSLAESPDGLRIHSGLLSLNHRTIPERRVQGVHVRVPLMWRIPGWARLTVDVAGSVASATGGDKYQPAVNTLVPVASVHDVRAVFTRVSGVELDQVPLTPVPRRARWLDPFAAGWMAVGLADGVAVTRTGWLQRKTAVVPFARVQSVRAVQGPVQRLLGLASVHVDGAVGSAGWVAPHRDVAEAQTLVRELSTRAQAFRHAES